MACLECTQKCILLHNTRNSSPEVTSFFKVMIGAQYEQLLYLPPKFAPTVLELVNQKTHLEDSSRRQWEVTISKIDESCAFQQGWNAFALDHGLKVGDFVVFNYIIGSHFFVKIYSDTGCEKLYFSENSNQNKRTSNQNKRTGTDKTFSQNKIIRTNGNFMSGAGPFDIIDKSSMKKQTLSTSLVSSSQSQCKVNDAEMAPIVAEDHSNCKNSYGRPQPVSNEVQYMINRDLGGKQDKNRSPILDLFEFEMLQSNSNVDGSKKVAVEGRGSHQLADASLGMPFEADLVDDGDPMVEGIANTVSPLHASEIEMINKHDCANMQKLRPISDNDSSNKNSGHPLITSAGKPEKNGVNSSHMLNGEIKICGSAEERGNTQSGEMAKAIKQDPGVMTVELCSHKDEMTKKICGEVPKAIDRENGQSSNVIVKDNDEVHKLVKTEDPIGISLADAVSISCLVGSNSQSLALPTCLPKSFRSAKLQKKLIFLRDTANRLWPVYYESSEVQALMKGWDAFSKANNIQPGDECVFEIENELEDIYAVRIVRK